MTPLLWNLLDLLLAGLLLGLGWAAVSSPDLKRGVVMFIAAGLMLAIVWARLNAPDVALAEAAIGAGISGALLLAALRDAPPSDEREESVGGPSNWLVSLFCVGVAGAVFWGLSAAFGSGDSTRLAGEALARLDDSGVSHPVTAVLLNYRAYDTLLELAVLLAAVLGVLAVGPARPAFAKAGSLLGALVRWLVPLLIVTAAYLLWAGAHAPGGAFQAGALLASAAVVLRLSGFAGAGLPTGRALRWLSVAGIALFLGVGVGVTALDLAVLEYPEGWAGGLILLIETGAMLTIASLLALAYIGGRPADWDVSKTAVGAREERP